MKLQQRTSLALVLAFVLLCATASQCKNASEWESRVIYQLLTDRFATASPDSNPCTDLSNYCSQFGSAYNASVAHLDYIKSMGFSAIWISPFVTNTAGGYHGYWALDIDSVNAHFGTKGELAAFIGEAHKRDIWVMLDVVANHMGPLNDGADDFSEYAPFNESRHYHACVAQCNAQCSIDDYTCFTDEIVTCRLSGLPDLNQTDVFVRQRLLEWVARVVDELGVDGLRVDTVPEVDAGFWQQFQHAAGVFAIGEVFNGDIECVSAYTKDALDSALSYPMFFTLRSVFQQGQSMNQLNATLDEYASNIAQPAWLGSFVDNHDNPRFLFQNGDMVAYRAALTWVMLAEGLPIVYYGTEFAFDGGPDPACREPLWPTNYDLSEAPLASFISTVLAHRAANELYKYEQVQRYSNDDEFYAFSRGLSLVALTNQKQDIERQVCYTPYAPLTKLCSLFDANDCIMVSAQGCAPIYLNNGETKIFSPV
jgi:alpha-amylase